MTKKILVLGAKGNMGSRYVSILRHLGHKVIEHDLWELNTLDSKVADADGVIIATPTESHILHICQVHNAKYGIPILCEKPIEKDLTELEKFIDKAKAGRVNLRMVNQYAFITPPGTHGPHPFSEYDYYHSGKDGRIWDCINIIGLDTTGNTVLRGESPIWKCKINGHELRREDMDQAYLMMIEDWIKRPLENLEYILKTHRKVMEARTKSSLVSKPGQPPIVSLVNAGKISAANPLPIES